MAASLNFCSRCGARLSFGAVDGEDRHRLACTACGHIAYVNPRLVVTTFPITDAGEIVLDPPRHRARQGLRGRSRAASSRSTRRSTRRPSARRSKRPDCSSSPARSIGLYTRLEASVVTIAFEARIVGGTAAPTPEATEIVAYAPEAHPVGRRSRSRRRWALTTGRCATRLARPSAVARISTGAGRSAQVDEDVLRLGVELERRHPELAPDAGHLVAAERRLGVDRRVRVDADDAGLERLRGAQRLADVTAPDRAGQAVRRRVGEAERLLLGVERR